MPQLPTSIVRASLALLFINLLAWAVLSSAARAQSGTSAYYSTSGIYRVAQPSPQVAGSGHVSAGANAADGDFATYATLKVDATVQAAVPVALLLKLSGTAPAGYRAGVILANTATGLANVQLLGTVTLRTYLNGTTAAQQQEEQVLSAALVRAKLGNGNGTRPTQLEFFTAKPFDAVEVEFASVLNIDYAADIFYAYGVRPGVQTRAEGYLSRFAAPVAGTHYRAESASGLLCVATDVSNAAHVADLSLTNYAVLKSTASVLCNPSLRAQLADTPAGGAPAGHYAGFVIGQQSLLDVSVLSGLRLTTYLNGVQREQRTGLGLLHLTLLPDNKALVSFAAGLSFDEVKIERVGLLTALDDLAVYYAFGLAPAAFQGINPVLSNFGAPQAGVDYFHSSPQVVNVGLSVVNGVLVVSGTATLSQVIDPQKAADTNISASDYAVLSITGTNLFTNANTATAYLEVKLNGSGQVGNRVGMVVSSNGGLLSASALQQLTLSTYDASNAIIESKTGTELLNAPLLDGSNRSEVSFLASRDFSYVRLDVTSPVALSSNTRVYYAFAQDVPLLSLQFPLPVELSRFEGKWVNRATELRWTTAAEQNSRHFVVERSTAGDGAYEAIGRVAAAGSSSSARSYQLRDAEAGRLGASQLYYRLRQVDTDGRESFSPVVAVAVSTAAHPVQLDVYPNPAARAADVHLACHDMPASGGHVVAYTSTGRVAYAAVLRAGSEELRLPELPAGLYHVVVRDAEGGIVAAKQLLVSNY